MLLNIHYSYSKDRNSTFHKPRDRGKASAIDHSTLKERIIYTVRQHDRLIKLRYGKRNYQTLKVESLEVNFQLLIPRIRPDW